jgi:dipeptidyl aminopeptidase/acylaminoacyl peptidase
MGVRLLIGRGIADRDRIGITGLSDGSSTVQFAAINSHMFKAGSASGCCWDPFQDAFLGPDTARAFHSFGWPQLVDYNSGVWNRMSLVQNARAVEFPLLIQQSDDEFRGALASYTALQQAGNPVALFVFPGEHHIKWQPAHRLAVYERNIRWFDYWLKGIGTKDEWNENQ